MPNVAKALGGNTYEAQTTAIFNSTDGGASWSFTRTVQSIFTVDAFWYRDRMFGEGCIWFYGSPDLTGTGNTFNRWVTYDYGATWTMNAPGLTAGDWTTYKPYVAGETKERLFGNIYKAAVPSLGTCETNGTFAEFKDHGPFIKGSSFVLPEPNFSGFYIASTGKRKDKDRVFPQLPGLMRFPT
jgi:hypothetical protein